MKKILIVQCPIRLEYNVIISPTDLVELCFLSSTDRQKFDGSLTMNKNVYKAVTNPNTSCIQSYP